MILFHVSVAIWDGLGELRPPGIRGKTRGAERGGWTTAKGQKDKKSEKYKSQEEREP